MVVLFCKKLLQSCKIFLFIREMNEPMMAIRGKAFHNLLYQSSCSCLFFFLHSFVHICYSRKLEIFVIPLRALIALM